MRRSKTNSLATSSTWQQASDLFAAHQQTIYQSTDRMFAALMAVQWIAGIVAALWITPRTWIGTQSQTHIHVWAAIFLGALISAFPIILALVRPGESMTRYVIATAQMMMSALLIHLSGGRIETHFHVFGSLAFLAFYRDWRVLLPATIVVAVDHFLRGVFWPQSVYGVLSASPWRWLEHAGWVLFEDAFLIIAIKRSVGEMWGMAQRTAELNYNQELLKADNLERQRAEEALKESQEWLTAIFDSSRDGIVVEADERIVYVNQSYALLFGYQPEELIGQPVWLVSEKEPSERMLKYGRNRLLGEEAPSLYEFRGTRKDQTAIDLEASVSTAKIGAKTCIISLCRDITERKRMEDERQIISAIFEGVIATSDLNDLLALIHRSIGKCIYAENCFVALYDEATELMHFEFWVDKLDLCPPPRPIGVGFSSFVLRSGRPLLLDRERTEQMYRSGEVEKSGSASASWLGVPLRTPSRTIGVLVVQHYEDENAYTQSDVDFLVSVAGQIALVIERKRAEDALSNQRTFLRQVIDLNPSFIFAKDREGRFTLINQALAEAYGTTVEELLGKTDRDFNPNKEEVEWFRRDDLEVMDKREEKFIPEELITDAAGNSRWLQTIKRPIISEDGTARQILGVATDITARKNAEQALHESEHILRQTQKMESIGTMAGGIAHDFNNLMTAVTGYSELALRSLGESDPLRPKIEEIKKAGDRAVSLTRQLLAFSRKQMLQPKVLDLNSVVTGMAQMLPRIIGENIDLRLMLTESLGQIKADPSQIEQVIMNLAVNARDAMPEGGSLALKTENVQVNDRIGRRHSVVAPGHYVMMSVSDNGCGMDNETQSHIFEPFFTTKGVGKGTGLGLSTVYGIVKQSGGTVWVYSEVGKGTTFKVYLPRVDEIPEIEMNDSGLFAVTRGRETVLLVEDEDVVRNLSKEILENYGYSVMTATNGKEGLHLGKEFEGHIDLLITDVIMPQMGGRELADGLKAFRPNTKILYMSGFADDAIVHHGVLDNTVFFIQKPFSPDALAAKAREVLDQAT